ncbi:hypothetical protein M514_04697 [Trichuris suis]|uniref:Uncharacterized protein n=1 Tax=Trichuris suis TaxID=68888 RepID=A0A085MAV8_9BILA|nr:hypothetical protein M513_04697 [Trichuris suis]KFD65822.1 hypothetical protein M514_04697 [Trichuris suis]KHJ42328.1 hypothetical protein D918_07668 [Trichuris suis]
MSTTLPSTKNKGAQRFLVSKVRRKFFYCRCKDRNALSTTSRQRDGRFIRKRRAALMLKDSIRLVIVGQRSGNYGPWEGAGTHPAAVRMEGRACRANG